MNRRQRFHGRGILTALLIAPRDFNYTNCEKCERTLYYTYLGEACPCCGNIITDFQHGRLPKAKGNGHSPKREGNKRARGRGNRHKRRAFPRSRRDGRAGVQANPATKAVADSVTGKM